VILVVVVVVVVVVIVVVVLGVTTQQQVLTFLCGSFCFLGMVKNMEFLNVEDSAKLKEVSRWGVA